MSTLAMRPLGVVLGVLGAHIAIELLKLAVRRRRERGVPDWDHRPDDPAGNWCT